MVKTLGELAKEIDENDQGFKSFVRGFDVASRIDRKPTSEYSEAMLPWLWGRYTGEIDGD
jgi:hypothetical protein